MVQEVVQESQAPGEGSQVFQVKVDAVFTIPPVIEDISVKRAIFTPHGYIYEADIYSHHYLIPLTFDAGSYTVKWWLEVWKDNGLLHYTLVRSIDEKSWVDDFDTVYDNFGRMPWVVVNVSKDGDGMSVIVDNEKVRYEYEIRDKDLTRLVLNVKGIDKDYDIVATLGLLIHYAYWRL
jgi:hypothetical protein